MNIQAMKCTHTIHDHTCHHGWNNANNPAIKIAPGETVAFNPPDSSGGQITAKSTLDDLGKLDFSKVNPVAGPIFIDGKLEFNSIAVVLTRD